MTNAKLSTEDIEKLNSIVPKIHFLKQQLQPVVNESILKEFSDIDLLLKEVLSPFWEKEKILEDKEYKKLSKIQNDNQFSSFWSIPLNINKFSNKFSKHKVYQINYDNATPINFPKGEILTWFDMWKYAEQLIKNSEDLHHIFIENFKEDSKKPGYYTLITGS